MSENIKKNNVNASLDAEFEQKSGKIKVTKIRSNIGVIPTQRKTLIGLGLRKTNKSKILNDTVSIRGMINKVKHLVQYEII